jgi:hypothetical protein
VEKENFLVFAENVSKKSFFLLVGCCKLGLPPFSPFLLSLLVSGWYKSWYKVGPRRRNKTLERVPNFYKPLEMDQNCKFNFDISSKLTELIFHTIQNNLICGI